jgi:hypothetical protein
MSFELNVVLNVELNVVNYSTFNSKLKIQHSIQNLKLKTQNSLFNIQLKT